MRVTYIEKTAQTAMPKWVTNFMVQASKTFVSTSSKKDLFRALVSSGIITKEIVLQVMNESGQNVGQQQPQQTAPIVPAPGIAQQPASGAIQTQAPGIGQVPPVPNMAV